MLSLSISSNRSHSVANLSKSEALQALADKKVYTYRKRDIILPEQLDRRLYVVVSGKLKIGSTLSTGKVLIQDIIGEGGVIGAFTPGAVRSNCLVQVATPFLSLIVIYRQEFTELSDQLQVYIYHMIQQRIRRLEKQLENRSEREIHHRVIDLLCEMGRQYGQEVGFETKIDNPLTHAEMASLVGTSRQSVSTVLAILRRKNWINYNRRFILIRDLSRLETINAQEEIDLETNSNN